MESDKPTPDSPLFVTRPGLPPLDEVTPYLEESSAPTSQQLAKNLFLSGNRNFWRKGEEAIITLMLEGVLGKKRILELYLNVVEWGNLIYGIEAVSEHYYHKQPADRPRGGASRRHAAESAVL